MRRRSRSTPSPKARLTPLPAAPKSEHHSFDNLIAQLISDFVEVGPDKIDACILRALGELGRYVRADRAYIVLMRNEHFRASIAREWCADGVEPHVHRLQEVDLSRTYPGVAKMMREHQPIIIEKMDDLPDEMATERASFEHEGTRSLLIVPVVRAGLVGGFIGFDSIRRERNWPEQAVSLLFIIGKVIFEALERTRVEAAVRESEERFRNLVQNLSDVILVVDAQTVCSFASPSVRRLFGYRTEELLGRRMLDLVLPEDVELIHHELQLVVTGKNSGVPTTVRCRRADGSNVTIDILGTNLLDNPAVQGIVVTARDVSERLRLEAERRLLSDRIQQTQKLESLGILAGGIAHDFNNLLTGILGHASIALSELALEAPVRPHVEVIKRTAVRAAELTQQMLAYSGRGRFVSQVVNLSEVVEEMGHLLSVSVSKKATLRYDFAPELPPVEVDAAQIRQVVMNLIVNASEALGENSGEIDIRTTRCHFGNGYVSHNSPCEILPPGDYVVLSVSDTGSGMPPAMVTRIFEPFFTTKFTGRGLGLAAVLGIVRGHHGAISVFTEQGRGSRFEVVLPMAPHPMALPVVAPAPAPNVDTPVGGLALVVDDEEIVRLLTRSMLERLGFTTLVARDGDAGLELFSKNCNELRLVILDLTMPKLDGLETFQRMRKIREQVPVLLTSGYAEQDAVSRFAGLKLAGFIQKPYGLEDLSKAVRRALDTHTEPATSGSPS